MGRRKTSKVEGANMDSLMDTLTNIVGILIIILIMVQIGLSQAMKKIISELPPVTEEELQDLEKQQQDNVVKIKDHEDNLKKTEQTKNELATTRRELADLEAQIQTKDAFLLDRERLEQQLNEQKTILTAQQEVNIKLIEEKNRLEAILAAPIAAPEPSKVVRIPNAKAIPERARMERILITDNQIFYIDLEAAEKVVMDEFKAARRSFDPDRFRNEQNVFVTAYNQEKIAQHFEQKKLRLGNLDLVVPQNRPWTRLNMRVTPRKGEGWKPEATMNSPYVNLLRQWRGKNVYIWFYVTKDSFETYLKAREISDQAEIAAGWEPMTNAVFNKQLEEFEVKRLEQPKPPPPPDPNAVNIPPPKKSLD